MEKWVIVTIVALITLAVVVGFVAITKPAMWDSLKRALSTYLVP